MSPDWSAQPEPVPYAKLDNPQSLNLYAYVQNNPINNIDPDGHWCVFGKIGTTCTQPPPPPKPPKPPKMKGVNPVDGLPGFARDPKGKPGHERPGIVDGSGRFHAPRPKNHPPLHSGEDISGVAGQSYIFAATDGTVTFSSNKPGSNPGSKGMGGTMIIDDGKGTETTYGHTFFNDVSAGSPVFQGEIIGVLGQSGNAEGQPDSEAHLHFEVRVNGEPVDPALWLNLPEPK